MPASGWPMPCTLKVRPSSSLLPDQSSLVGKSALHADEASSVSILQSPVSSFQFSVSSRAPLGAVLVTDAAEAMGLAPGEHRLGDMVVVLEDHHRLTVKGTDTLAGR